VFFAACGGGGGGGDDKGASAEDFLASVDAICADTSKQVTELQNTQGTPQTLEQLKAFLPKRLAISQSSQQDAEALEPPDELSDDYDAYLAKRREFIDSLVEQQQAAEKGDGAAATRLGQEQADLGGELTAAAARVGLSTCAGKAAPATSDDVASAANAACIERAEMIRDQFNEVDNPTTVQDFADLLPDRIRIEQQAVDKLDAIDVPAGGKPANVPQRYDAFVADERRVVAGYKAALGVANRADTAAFQRANQAVDQLELTAAQAASGLGLSDCANTLPADQIADVKAAIENIWLHADAAHCTDDYTSQFVDDIGGQDACEKSELPAGEADSVDIATDIHGNSEVTANAAIVIHGGTHDGEQDQVFFEFVDGRWKLDQLVVTKAPSQ
jgi:hypothetical protein